jgi:hypothetical protein
MSDEWAVGKKRPSTVSDWKKLIRDFRDQFPYDPLTALIVETFANALDAEATKIEIQVNGANYRILDNGKGMSQYELKEYHNIASLTKRRGEGIGFAGIGAKVFLDRAEHTITETKSEDFRATTHWAFYKDSLEWKPIGGQCKVKYPTGTCVEVKLTTNEDIDRLNPQFVKETLQQFYNAVLLGYYDAKSVSINGIEVEPWHVPQGEVERQKNLEFKYGKHRIFGFLVKSTNALPEQFQGPFIVVYGKTVMQWWFRQYPVNSETFYGLILADPMIVILRTSKSDFDRTSLLWKKFHGKMGQILSQWLEEIGAKPGAPPASTDLDRMSRELEKSINQVLKMPEFSDLANSLFQNILKRTVAIQSAASRLTGTEIEGKQTTAGTLGGSGEGKGVDTLGDAEGKGIAEDDSGLTPIERVRRRVKSLVRIGWDEQSNNQMEGWIDPGKSAIIINTGHAAWKVADGLTLQARDERVRVYHVLRTVFATLIEEGCVESPRETLSKLFSSWYASCIKG